MAFLTDRKRAQGHGSARSGTEHMWHMTVTSYALLILIPLFVFTFGSILGSTHEEVLAYYARPFPAIITGLTFAVGMIHFKSGAQVLIEDYVHGYAQKLLIIALTCLSYALIAVGLFALARMAI